MPIIPHWFLPTNGDSRSNLSLGNAVGGEGNRVLADLAGREPRFGIRRRGPLAPLSLEPEPLEV